jgi:hypothetical protein
MANFSPPSDGLKGIAPRSLTRCSRPLIEIGEVKDSLHKEEPPARSSEGK